MLVEFAATEPALALTSVVPVGLMLNTTAVAPAPAHANHRDQGPRIRISSFSPMPSASSRQVDGPYWNRPLCGHGHELDLFGADCVKCQSRRVDGTLAPLSGTFESAGWAVARSGTLLWGDVAVAATAGMAPPPGRAGVRGRGRARPA